MRSCSLVSQRWCHLRSWTQLCSCVQNINPNLNPAAVRAQTEAVSSPVFPAPVCSRPSAALSQQDRRARRTPVISAPSGRRSSVTCESECVRGTDKMWQNSLLGFGAASLWQRLPGWHLNSNSLKCCCDSGRLRDLTRWLILTGVKLWW